MAPAPSATAAARIRRRVVWGRAIVRAVGDNVSRRMGTQMRCVAELWFRNFSTTVGRDIAPCAVFCSNFAQCAVFLLVGPGAELCTMRCV